MFGFFQRRRRERLRAAPLPAAWKEILERNVALYRRMPPEDRRELAGHVQVLLDEKVFEGCNGQEIDDEVRVTIAAPACVLLLHRDTNYYPATYSILVYPTIYVAPTAERLDDGTVAEGEDGREGEAWEDGAVVLSWDDVLADARGENAGHNLVLHEFAHQLDDEDGAANGAPLLPRRDMYPAWTRVLTAAYEQLQADSARRLRTVLDPYGATDPAEFFAVATECFFENPAALRRRHRELYELLAEFYRQDPALWAVGQER